MNSTEKNKYQTGHAVSEVTGCLVKYFGKKKLFKIKEISLYEPGCAECVQKTELEERYRGLHVI